MQVLSTIPKLKKVAKKIMQQKRSGFCSSPNIPPLQLARPEDILNVSIQSQEAILSQDQELQESR